MVTVQFSRGVGGLSKPGLVRLWTSLGVVLPLGSVRSQERTDIFVPVYPALWPWLFLAGILCKWLFVSYILINEISEPSRAELCFLMIIYIVPFLQTLQVYFLQLRLHDWSQLQEEIKLPNEILPISILSFNRIINDNIMEPPVNRIDKKLSNI